MFNCRQRIARTLITNMSYVARAVFISITFYSQRSNQVSVSLSSDLTTEPMQLISNNLIISSISLFARGKNKSFVIFPGAPGESKSAKYIT